MHQLIATDSTGARTYGEPASMTPTEVAEAERIAGDVSSLRCPFYSEP